MYDLNCMNLIVGNKVLSQTFKEIVFSFDVMTNSKVEQKFINFMESEKKEFKTQLRCENKTTIRFFGFS